MGFIIKKLFNIVQLVKKLGFHVTPRSRPQFNPSIPYCFCFRCSASHSASYNLPGHCQLQNQSAHLSVGVPCVCLSVCLSINLNCMVACQRCFISLHILVVFFFLRYRLFSFGVSFTFKALLNNGKGELKSVPIFYYFPF